MGKIFRTYLKGLRKVLEEGDNTLELGKLVYQDVKNADTEIRSKLETQPEYSFRIMISNTQNLNFRQHMYAACAFGGRYFADDRKEIKELKSQEKKLPSTYSKSIIYYRENFEKTKEIVNKGVQAAYNRRTKEIIVKALGESHWRTLKNEAGAVPLIFKPLYGLMKEKTAGQLKGNIFHEGTHAYVHQKTGYSNQRDRLRDIDEAAALTVSEIMGSNHSIHTEGRKESGLDMEKVKKYKKLFERYVSGLKQYEAIDKIRRKAAESINLAQEGENPENSVKKALSH
jgi:hypothetical protein